MELTAPCQIVEGGWNDPRSYGPMRKFNGVWQHPHRVAWQQAHGPVPSGMMVLHHCDVRRCIELSHLYVGSPQDNMDDMVRRGRSHQPRPQKKRRSSSTS